jgi:hypothetical protein
MTTFALATIVILISQALQPQICKRLPLSFVKLASKNRRPLSESPGLATTYLNLINNMEEEHGEFLKIHSLTRSTDKVYSPELQILCGSDRSRDSTKCPPPFLCGDGTSSETQPFSTFRSHISLGSVRPVSFKRTSCSSTSTNVIRSSRRSEPIREIIPERTSCEHL